MNNLNITLQETRSKLMTAIYGRMGIGVLLTAITAVLVASNPSFVERIFVSGYHWGFIIGELALVWFISARVHKLDPTTSLMLFLLYSVLNGVTLSIIFLAYSLGSIGTAFFVSTGMFLTMAVYGYTTKKDLTSIGSILFMALIGLIIASVVNIFLGSSMLDWLISFIGVILFSGLTMYDSQRIRKASDELVNAPTIDRSRYSNMLALSMYLNFINLFLFVLRLVGGGRD